MTEWFKALDFNLVAPGSNSAMASLARVVFGSPEFNSSTMLVRIAN